MKHYLMACAMSVALAGGAQAETIGITLANLDFPFLQSLQSGMTGYAKTHEGLELKIEDARSDASNQMSQVQGFIASGVDAIIVNAADTEVTPKMTQLASEAGVPIVYVNRQPADVESLPDTAAFVGSNELDSGTLQMEEVCKMMDGEGEIVVLMGELSAHEAKQRTADVHMVIETDACNGISIIDEQTANWNRDQAEDLMNNWLSAGIEPNAVVANNDEMALGALRALNDAGVDMDDVVVAGIDAISDALDAMQAGELDVTVFQNAAAQGSKSIETALKLAKGEKLDSKIWVPFELVTQDNMAEYAGKN